MAKMNGGVGEYFTNPVGGDPSGIGQVYRDGSLGGDPSGIGQVFRDGSLGHVYQDGSLGNRERAIRDGSLGATIAARPRPAVKQLRRQSVMGLAGGVGDISQTEMAGVVVLGVVVRGLAGYFAGCAMGDKYKWWGAGSAAVGGALGLGILGFIAYQKKG